MKRRRAGQHFPQAVFQCALESKQMNSMPAMMIDCGVLARPPQPVTIGFLIVSYGVFAIICGKSGVNTIRCAPDNIINSAVVGEDVTISNTSGASAMNTNTDRGNANV